MQPVAALRSELYLSGRHAALPPGTGAGGVSCRARADVLRAGTRILQRQPSMCTDGCDWSNDSAHEEPLRP